MSKKSTQNQPTTKEAKTALAIALEQANDAIEANGKDIEVLAVTEAPTHEEKLSDFLNSYGKLITVDFTELAGLVSQLSDNIAAGNIAEHADVVTAKAKIAELETNYEALTALPEDIAKFARIGIQAEVAKAQATIESHKDDNPVHRAMLERIFFTLHEAGKIKFGKTSKRRGGGTRTSKPQIEDADVWPFSYKTSRTLKDGTTFEVGLTEGYIFGHAHPKVVEAKVPNPSDKVIVTTKEGLVMGHLSKTLSKSMLLGQSVAIVAGLDESAPAKVSETGISGLSNGRTEELLRSIPTPHVAILSNGKNSELAAVGSKAQTEKATA